MGFQTLKLNSANVELRLNENKPEKRKNDKAINHNDGCASDVLFMFGSFAHIGTATELSNRSV